MNPFWMVAADLRKTLLSSLGVLVLLGLAFSVSIAISLFDRALREAGARSARDVDLVIGAPGSRLDLVLAAVYLRTDEVLPLLPQKTVEALSLDRRVAALSPVVFADHHAGGPIVGVGPDFPALRPSLRLASGRWPRADFEVTAGASTGAVVGEGFEGSHGAHEQEGVEEEAHHEAEYRVVGVLEATGSPWDRAYVTPYQGVWTLHGTPEADRAVSALLVRPKDFASAYALRAQYREKGTTAAFPGEVLAGLFGLFDQVKDAVSAVSFLFQGLVFLAVLLSLLASLPSKARWIGLLRALGAGPGYVFLTLWLQVALVLGTAGAFGAVAGWATAQALAQYATGLTGLALSPSWTVTETLLLASFAGVGLVGALLPAWGGYRTSVRQSLLGR